MSFGREGALEKISALLATAAEEGGATEGERANAVAMAQRLMNKHRIEEHEIGRAGGRQAGPDVEYTILGYYKQGSLWLLDLLEAVARPMTVDILQTRVVGGAHARIVGRSASVAYVRLVAGWIQPQLERLCAVALDAERTGCVNAGLRWSWAETIRFKRSFYAGATSRLASRLAEEAAAEDGVGTDLIRSDRAEVDAYYASVGMKIQSFSISVAPVDGYANRAGTAAGDRVDVNPGNKVARAPQKELTA